MQMIEAYNEGLKEFNKGDVFLQQKNLMRLNFYILNQFGHPGPLLWQHMFIIHNFTLTMQYKN